MMKKKITYEATYKGYKINTNKEKKLGCFTSILNKTIDIIEDARDNHSKVFFMRFDLRYPEDEKASMDDNEKIKSFMNSFNKSLKRKKLDPKYLWSRECSKEKKPHFHAFLCLDGNKTQKIDNHIKKAEELWNKQLGLNSNQNNGLVNSCTKDRNGNPQKNGIMIKRNSKDYNESLDKCVRWSSYISKENTKKSIPGVRNFGSSKIPK